LKAKVNHQPKIQSPPIYEIGFKFNPKEEVNNNLTDIYIKRNRDSYEYYCELQDKEELRRRRRGKLDLFLAKRREVYRKHLRDYFNPNPPF
jgi:hypothetical protein